jgi:hypothetical protein
MSLTTKGTGNDERACWVVAGLGAPPPMASAGRCNPTGTPNDKRMPMIKRLFTALVTAVAVATIAPTAAHAARGLLTVGMKLTFKYHDCSLGFFATDSVGDQLAVTAGHCAEGLGEKVYSTFGQQIGEVVAWQPDAKDGNGNLTGSRGFTVVYTYKRFRIEAFFARVGTANVGDHVRLYGQRTCGTNGTIIDVSYTAGHPDLDLLTSDVLQLPGDSGGPLYTQGPTLVGIASSVHTETGGARVAQAQPLGSLEQEIKPVRRYGAGFSVYTQG